MAYTEEKKKELRKEATDIWLRIIEGVKNAIESNDDVTHVKDLLIMGEKMTYVMRNDEWIENLDNARIYFEDLEEYGICTQCRDLKRKIADRIVIPMSK